MMKKRRKKRYWSGLANLFIVLQCFVDYFDSLTCFATFQVQPLSLEELLAKKKAEEEAEAKVSYSLWYTSSFPF